MGSCIEDVLEEFKQYQGRIQQRIDAMAQEMKRVNELVTEEMVSIKRHDLYLPQ